MTIQKLFAPLLLSLSITGCFNNQDPAHDIKDKFTAIGQIEKLQYSELNVGFYLVKADDEIYFYNSSAKSNFIIPAPKAYDLNRAEYVNELIKSNKYALKTIFDHKNLSNIKAYAKSDISPPIVEEHVQVGATSTQLIPHSEPIAPKNPEPILPLVSSEQKSTTAIKPSIEPVAVAPSSALDNVSQKATDAGEARLNDLRKQLQDKFLAAKKSLGGNSAAQTPQSSAPLSLAPLKQTDITTPPPKALVKGDQFTYFNGTPVLKINRNKDGSFATAEKKKESIISMAEKIPMSWTINFPAVGQEKFQLFVFTDFTCPFCKKLHNDLPLLQNAGITVRYLFYPRSYTTIPETPAGKLHMDMMRRAWCAPEPGEAMSELFDTKTLEDYKCEEVPEAKGRINFPGPYHHFLGTVFNIEGTPSYFSNDGRMDTGYQNFNDFMANKLK